MTVVAARLPVVVATFGVKAAWVRQRWRGRHGSTKDECANDYAARQPHGGTPPTNRAAREERLSVHESTDIGLQLAEQDLADLSAHCALPGFFLPLLTHLDLLDQRKVSEFAITGMVAQNQIVRCVRSFARLRNQVLQSGCSRRICSALKLIGLSHSQHRPPSRLRSASTSALVVAGGCQCLVTKSV